MAKTRPSRKSKTPHNPPKSAHSASAPRMDPSSVSTSHALLTEAAAFLYTSQPESALPLASRALALLTTPALDATAPLPALSLLVSITIELGDFPAALSHLHHAVRLDPTGEHAGPSSFLWLAQLSPDGGADSIKWYTLATDCLRRELAGIADPDADEAKDKRKALATALCGMVEVWMTDLSWEADAEEKCERAVGEALLVVPADRAAEVWQTVASVRVSQTDLDGAREALRRSLALWMDEEEEEEEEEEAEAEADVPEFATRVALVRLLLEVGMMEEALTVVDRLVREDDESVECWYLGGWGMYLLGLQKEAAEGGEDEWTALLASGREWLTTALELYRQVEYQDERLMEHALELVAELDGRLGPEEDGDSPDEDDDSQEGERDVRMT